jgi:hypothetical protein
MEKKIPSRYDLLTLYTSIHQGLTAIGIVPKDIIADRQRTDLTNHLHGSAGFRTDTQIVTKKAMKSIIASIKTSKDEKDNDEA